MISQLKLSIKKLIAPFIAPLYRGRGSILMFHRILPEDGRPRVHTKALDVTPERLEEIILFFKSKKYDFIKMEQIESYLSGAKKGRFVVFTFDDGYFDNYTIAYPIFKKHNIPFTIYLTTDFPDHKHILWHYMLENLMLKNIKLDVELNNEINSFDLNSTEQKEKVYNVLRRYLIDQSIDERNRTISEWFLEQEGDLSDRIRKESMTWNQIVELSREPLAEIGAHTISHPSLSTLDESRIITETKGCADRIEEITGKRPRHFAYPFGSKNEIKVREVSLLSASEFKTAVTTREGNVFSSHIRHLHSLPRIYIGPKTNLTDIDLFISGKTPFLRNSFNRIITV